MRRIVVAGFMVLLIAGAASAQRSRYFSNAKKLTDDGQSSNASWSPDGTKLVFQSTRDGQQCNQIYVMNADGSGAKMVSTGQGVANFGYFMPDGEHILYASTHGASPECPPEPERSQGYTWPVHASYDLYVTDLDGSEHKQLTSANVYDAEGTVNWATSRIVYTSLASGDLELWSMGLDGKNKSKLTSGIGYDGGAMFSPDGRWLAWRAHHPLDSQGRMNYQDLLAQNLTAPSKMEIYIGDEYGMAAKKLTNTGCASLTPRFTADGKQIIFSSNMNNCDTREFELFIMDARDGYMEQVTRFYASTTSPAFSPDGKKITFTSSINGKDNSVLDIFVADWNE